MKRLTLVAVTMAFLGIVAASYAEVQQVRLSGELRLRGYWVRGLHELNNNGGIEESSVSDSDTYVAQRTRISVEADLEDHVLVVATLQAAGVWGTKASGTGFGTTDDTGYSTTRFDSRHADTVELVEAYVRFQELFWTPMTLTIGRQGLHFGNGLIISNTDKENRFDAARFTWDQADKGFTFDFVASKLAERQSASAPGAGVLNGTRDGDMFFANMRWEPKDVKFLKDVEFYGGYLSNPSDAPWDSVGAESTAFVWLFGIRGDLNGGDKAKGLNLWWEAAAEMGKGVDSHPWTDNLNGWLLDLGASYAFDNMKWKPTAWVGWTLATGSEDSSSTDNRRFLPWFDYNTRGGFVVKPILSNIDILTFGVKGNVNDKWDVSGSVYRYFQNKISSDDVIGNPFVDNGGLTAYTNGTSRSLGWEFDLSTTYHYSKDVKASLMFGWFKPGGAFAGTDELQAGEKADSAYGMRGEITVNF